MAIAAPVLLWRIAAPLAGVLQRNIAAIGFLRTTRYADSSGICHSLEVTGSESRPLAIAWAGDDRSRVLSGVFGLARSDPPQAMLVLSQALAGDIGRPPDRFWLGCTAFQAGENAQAIRAWREAGALDYFILRGYHALVRRDEVTALTLYQIAAQIEPESSEAWLGVAEAQQLLALRGEAQWHDMLRAAERALALTPEEPQAHYLVGYGLWFLAREPGRTERELRWALEHRDNWLDAYALGRFLLDQGRAGEATQLMQRVLLTQDIPMVRGQMVRAYLAEGRCTDARREYAIALQRFPGLEEELLAMCIAYPACHCR
jgi:hypothetical protein